MATSGLYTERVLQINNSLGPVSYAVPAGKRLIVMSWSVGASSAVALVATLYLVGQGVLAQRTLPASDPNALATNVRMAVYAGEQLAVVLDHAGYATVSGYLLDGPSG